MGLKTAEELWNEIPWNDLSLEEKKMYVGFFADYHRGKTEIGSCYAPLREFLDSSERVEKKLGEFVSASVELATSSAELARATTGKLQEVDDLQKRVLELTPVSDEPS